MQELRFAFRQTHATLTHQDPQQTCADQSIMERQTDQRLCFKIEAFLTAMSMTGAGRFATALLARSSSIPRGQLAVCPGIYLLGDKQHSPFIYLLAGLIPDVKGTRAPGYR